MENYKALGWIGEGAHGVVLKARCSLTGRVVAVKKIPHRGAVRQQPAMRDIEVVRLLEVVASSSGVLLVFELLCCNLSTLIHNPERPLSEAHVKCCMRMLLCGLEHCHSMGILHRGESDIEQLCLVIKALGTPDEQVWPGVRELPDYHKISFSESAGIPWRTLLPDVSKHARDLVRAFVCYDPERRMTCSKALLHSFFWSEPLPSRPSELPVPQEQEPQFDMDACFGTCSQEASLGW
ncbi:hypothetical protein MTO96_007254 [Rhipicephalus appendiculatus]